MTKYVYEAAFNLSHEVTDAGIQDANRKLDEFTDFGESITENLFDRKVVVEVSAKLRNGSVGFVTVKSPQELTNGQLQWISNEIGAGLENINFLLGCETPTVNGKGFTEINWDSNINHFGLVSSVK